MAYLDCSEVKLSYRALFEMNLDMLHEVEKDPARFVKQMRELLGHRVGNGGWANSPIFGLRFLGMRHHTDPCSIDWGGITWAEGAGPQGAKTAAPVSP